MGKKSQEVTVLSNRVCGFCGGPAVDAHALNITILAEQRRSARAG